MKDLPSKDLARRILSLDADSFLTFTVNSGFVILLLPRVTIFYEGTVDAILETII